MKSRAKLQIYTILLLGYPVIGPLWMLLAGMAANLYEVLVWPIVYILINMNIAWVTYSNNPGNVDIEKKLRRKIYNIQSIASLFLGLYEGGAALALSGVQADRLWGVLAFTLYFFIPYAILTLWTSKLSQKLNSMKIAPVHNPQDLKQSIEIPNDIDR
jgi:hypothetical protein